MNKTENYSQLANLQGLFSIACAINQLAENAEHLFITNDTTELIFPDMTEPVTGYAEISAYLENRQCLIENSHTRDIPIFHTPSYFIEDNGEKAHVTWDVYSYRIDTLHRDMTFHTMQFQAICLLEKNRWKYQSIRWMEMQTFIPQEYQKEQTCIHQQNWQLPDQISQFQIEANDYLTIRNVHDLLAIKNWTDIIDLFHPVATVEADGLSEKLSGSQEIQKWLDSIHAYELDGNGTYRCLQMIGPAYLVLQNESTARGIWIGETFEVTPACEDNQQTIQRRICLFDHIFVKTSDSWKIKDYRLYTLYELPLIIGGSNLYQRMLYPEGNWIPISYDPTVTIAAPVFEIETLFALWPASLRRGELMSYFERYIKNSDGYSISIRSRGPQTPTLTDYDSVKTKLEDMDSVFINHQPSYHCASTPVMEVSPDGNTVRASWIDHSITNMSQAFGLDSENGTVPYMIFLSRYDHVFRKLNQKWYLTEFNWEPGLGFPNWFYAPSKTRGWSAKTDQEKYPLPLTYHTI